MTDDLQEGPLSQTQYAPAPKKLTAREQRRRRRQRRKRGEEVLAWVLVPTICFGLYWAVTAGFTALGTSPGQVWDQLMQVKAMMEKRAG